MVGNRIQGRITSGLAPGATVLKTLQFVESQLPSWRDMPDRPLVAGEEELNGQLCKYLNAAARRENFSMAYFHHEVRQTGQRRVDLSALPPDPAVIQGRSYTVLDPFLVLEGKRLPAPTREREREYVTGGDKKSARRAALVRRHRVGSRLLLADMSLPTMGVQVRGVSMQASTLAAARLTNHRRGNDLHGDRSVGERERFRSTGGVRRRPWDQRGTGRQRQRVRHWGP